MNADFGTVVLIGSGELTESMVKLHRALLARIENPLKPVFLDTPAGFELNADEISARAMDYFRQRFDVTLEIASFKSRYTATALQIEAALHKLRHANYILAGPGSPSYAIEHWRGSPIWDLVMARWKNGAALVFASAAAISLGCVALPVYEIFKAGHTVRWMDGLDMLSELGLDLAIVPHWNNAEGGNYDTRFCFMGEPRLTQLEQQLRANVTLLGIDEHTALIIEPGPQSCQVVGAGRVTWRYAGHEWSASAGETIAFDQLRAMGSENLPDNPPASLSAITPAPEIRSATQYLTQLARAMETSGGEPNVQRELVDHAHDAIHELAQGWRASDRLISEQNANALIDLLISIRANLRAAKQFSLADQIRDALGELGILIEDTLTGTIWKKR